MAEDMEITEVSETEPQTASSLSQEERERIAQLPYGHAMSSSKRCVHLRTEA